MTIRTMTTAGLLGALGYLPFLATAWMAVARWPYQTEALQALIAYGACILSFLGAVHWGFVLGDEAGTTGRPALRLTLGVVPSLIGFAALLVSQMGGPAIGLILIWGGVLVTWGTEHRFARRGWVPVAYLRLRSLLSLAVVTLLVGVQIVRLLGIDLPMVNFSG